jgi:hypothetical protein
MYETRNVTSVVMAADIVPSSWWVFGSNRTESRCKSAYLGWTGCLKNRFGDSA